MTATPETRSYVVVHETSYTYEQPVGLSRQIVRDYLHALDERLM